LSGGDGSRCIVILVPPARLELALLDPQVACKLWIIAANVLDEALGVLQISNSGQRDARTEPVRELGKVFELRISDVDPPIGACSHPRSLPVVEMK
jgi:hypothetical protein